jgi:hypothetical protein
VSGLCPICGPTEYVSPAQYAAYDARKHINCRSKVISPASHAEGRWFDPSRDHKHLCRPQDFQLCDFRSHAHNGPGYPPSRSSAEPVERIRHTIQVGIVEIRIGVRGDHDRRVAHRHLQ